MIDHANLYIIQNITFIGVQEPISPHLAFKIEAIFAVNNKRLLFRAFFCIVQNTNFISFFLVISSMKMFLLFNCNNETTEEMKGFGKWQKPTKSNGIYNLAATELQKKWWSE